MSNGKEKEGDGIWTNRVLWISEKRPKIMPLNSIQNISYTLHLQYALCIGAIERMQVYGGRYSQNSQFFSQQVQKSFPRIHFWKWNAVSFLLNLSCSNCCDKNSVWLTFNELSWRLFQHLLTHVSIFFLCQWSSFSIIEFLEPNEFLFSSSCLWLIRIANIFILSITRNEETYKYV